MRTSREKFQVWAGRDIEMRSTGGRVNTTHFQEVAAHISKMLNMNSNCHHVLDVGCDSGLVSRHVARLVNALIGVDFIAEMVFDVKHIDTGSNTRFMVADGASLPFRSQTFSRVYSYNVIHQMDSKEQGLSLIEEMIRVCQPGGIVLVGDVPDRNKRWQYISGELFSFKQPQFFYRWYRDIKRIATMGLKSVGGQKFELARLPIWYDLQDLKHCFEERGFSCDLIDQVTPLPYWFYRTNLRIKIPK